MKTELIVFGVIIIFIILMTLFFKIPENKEDLGLPIIAKAPEIVGILNWINSEPLKIEQLKGKVVLVDFWTYSCINCIRTLPYLKGWYEKYSDKNLVIIGVHTPEFEFEKDLNNVKAAVEKYGIKYPVALDSNRETWSAYKNNFWPRKYLIDKEGNIRFDHIGEGGYEETENVIQELLNEIDSNFSINMTPVSSDTDFSKIGTPELYLGYRFARSPLGNLEGFSPEQIVEYKNKTPELANTIYLSGKWENKEDRMISSENSKLFLIYKARKVNIVAGGKGKISILLDGKNLSKNFFGEDIKDENGSTSVFIDSQRLYNIVSGPNYDPHILEIDAESGFELYTFTFG